MKKKKSVLVIGGRGYVGSAITDVLKKELSVFTFDRHSGGKEHFKGSITDDVDLDLACRKKDIVINLVGFSPVGRYSYDEYFKAHVTGTKKVLQACKNNNVSHYIHMGALGNSIRSKHPYLSTKALAIQIVKKSRIKHLVINPSLIFDKQNELVSTIKKASFFRLFPRIPTRLQPVYRLDVAEIFVRAAKQEVKSSEIELAGPNVLSVFCLAKKVFASKGRKCLAVPLWLAKPFLWLFSNRNKYQSMFTESVAKHAYRPKNKKFLSLDEWLKREE